MCEYTEYCFYTPFEYPTWSYLIQHIWEWVKQKKHYSCWFKDMLGSPLFSSKTLKCNFHKAMKVGKISYCCRRTILVVCRRKQWNITALLAPHCRNLDSLLKGQHKNMKLAQWNLQLHNIKLYFSVVIHKISIIN